MNIATPQIDLAGLSSASSYVSSMMVLVVFILCLFNQKSPQQTLRKLSLAISIISAFFLCLIAWSVAANIATHKGSFLLITGHAFSSFIVSTFIYWRFKRGDLGGSVSKKHLLIICFLLFLYFSFSPSILFPPPNSI